jgi:hypothetical protein
MVCKNYKITYFIFIIDNGIIHNKGGKHMSLAKLIENRDIPAIKRYMSEHNLVIKDNKIVAFDKESQKALQRNAELWDQRQYAR